MIAIAGRLAWISIVVAISAIATACSIDHRSGDFACSGPQDCNGGRVCEDGFCVDRNAPDASRPDARPGQPDARRPDAAPTCPEPCTSCDLVEQTCIVDCTLTSCEAEVVCPPGYACDIRCNLQNTCRNGVDCTESKGCNITCSGTSSCRDVVCGGGPCNVNCTGSQSCRDVNCASSCACDIECPGPQSCQDGIICSELQCDIGLGCTNLIPGCNTCGD